MISNATSKFYKLDDKTFDFSRPHGQFHIVDGAGGHEINEIEEDWKDNKRKVYMQMIRNLIKM